MSARSRRWWLVLLAIASLVVLVFAGVTAGFSVRVTQEMADANRLPGAEAPAAGTRALVLPLADVTQVPTFQNGLGAFLGYNGSLLVSADPGSLFPARADNATMARALAYVAPTADGSYVPSLLTFVGVPTSDGNGTVLRDITVNVTEAAGGKSGFLVKGDAERNVTFVERDRVLGSVPQFDPGSTVLVMIGISAFGFLAPVIILIATHRPRAKPGIGGAMLCPECRNPVPLGADFCTRCGAWFKDGAKK